MRDELTSQKTWMFQQHCSDDFIEISYPLENGPATFLWQGDTPVTVGWFAGRASENVAYLTV